MDDAQRDRILMDISLAITAMHTDMVWIKRIIATMIIALAALLGVSLPPGLL